MSYRYHTYQSTPKTICGLAASDLSTELLEKIDFAKLLECIDQDYRIEHIAAKKLATEPMDNMWIIKKFYKSTRKHPAILDAYNKHIARNRAGLNKSSRTYYYLDDVIFPELLDKDNMKQEMGYWLDRTHSVLNDNSVNFALAIESFGKDKRLDEKIEKIINSGKDKYGYGASLTNLIKTIPESHMDAIYPEVLKMKSKRHISILSNPNTPKKYLNKALRAIAKRQDVPEIKVDINAEDLEALPSITRLEVIEALLFRANKLGDNFYKNFESKDDIVNLLFSSVLRYPDRVERVAKRFDDKLKLFRQNQGK